MQKPYGLNGLAPRARASTTQQTLGNGVEGARRGGGETMRRGRHESATDEKEEWHDVYLRLWRTHCKSLAVRLSKQRSQESARGQLSKDAQTHQ
eukprot:9477987-Pyramimonas_sp.AAC.1